MKLHEVYGEIKERIDRIRFDALFRGFRPVGFALYNENECCLNGVYIEKTDAFCANTSIDFQGERIAIWNLSNGFSDLDELAASIVHEMFHAFQELSSESRWPNEMQALKEYRYDAENLSIKLREARLMREILESRDSAKFIELLALRKARSLRFPAAFDYESRVEQIEGTANSVELAALSALAPEKTEKRWKTLLSRIADPKEYCPIRQISYLTGAAIFACIRLCSDFDPQAFSDVPFSIGVLDGVTPFAGECAIDPDAAACVSNYAAETERIIADAMRKNEIVLSGRYPLGSLNIWNARRKGSYAVSDYFVAYIDNGDWKTLNGDFVIELDEQDRILRVYAR